MPGLATVTVVAEVDVCRRGSVTRSWKPSEVGPVLPDTVVVWLVEFAIVTDGPEVWVHL